MIKKLLVVDLTALKPQIQLALEQIPPTLATNKIAQANGRSHLSIKH